MVAARFVYLRRMGTRTLFFSVIPFPSPMMFGGPKAYHGGETGATPLPEGNRLVLIETQNTLTNQPGRRVRARLPRMEVRAAKHLDLGAYRTDTRNLVAGNAAPESI